MSWNDVVYKEVTCGCRHSEAHILNHFGANTMIFDMALVGAVSVYPSETERDVCWDRVLKQAPAFPPAFDKNLVEAVSVYPWKTERNECFGLRSQPFPG